MTKEQQKLFDSWTKKQIYEAYLVEHEARLALNKDNIRLNQNIFNKSHEIKELKELITDQTDDILKWVRIKPKEYSKDGKPYGLIGHIEGEDGILYLACTVNDIDGVFTNSMLKDIIHLYNTRKICLITEVKSKQELIRRVLNRYDFAYEYRDGVMYSIGGKDEESNRISG